MNNPKPSPIVLIILDGWGYRQAKPYNAIAMAKTPVWDALWQKYPHTLLSGCGMQVGLPEGQMGNSEVGHLTIGSGRVIYQDLTRISSIIKNDLFNQNPILTQALDKALTTSQCLHILGLLSPGGVHSHEQHIHAMIKLAALRGVKNIIIHAFLDGRDTPPQSAKSSLETLETLCHTFSKSHPLITVRIGSISGRYYAMDRDKHWERTQAVYDLLTLGKADYSANSALEALAAAYTRGETDEFVKPTLINPSSKCLVKDKDVVIFMNFRADRARQLSYALTDPHFSGFSRKVFPKLLAFVTLTNYAKDIPASIAFPPEEIQNGLGEFLQKHNFRQLRIAETEKYAHVTFFFNGGREEPFLGEERILIPSPSVSTYDLFPAMSAFELTDVLVKTIEAKTYDVIICNYANADMIGHTGNIPATIEAIETLDTCLGRVVEALQKVEGAALITADHGNAEFMFDESTKQPHTAHTLSQVPFLYIGKASEITHENGVLSDIAPTMIYLLGLQPPAEMTGTSLVKVLLSH